MLHRKIQDNIIWQSREPFDKRSAFVSLIMNVQHTPEPQKVLIGNTIYTCYRGQSLKSIKTWAGMWKWSISKTRRFFKCLESESTIELKSEQQTTRITLCNFDSYNGTRTANEQQMNSKRTANEQQVNTDNNVNNINNEKNDNNIYLSAENSLKIQNHENETIPADISIPDDCGELFDYWCTKKGKDTVSLSAKDRRGLFKIYQGVNQDMTLAKKVIDDGMGWNPEQVFINFDKLGGFKKIVEDKRKEEYMEYTKGFIL